MKLHVTGPTLAPAVRINDCGVVTDSANVSVLGATVAPLVHVTATVTPPVPADGAAPGVTGMAADGWPVYSADGSVTLKSARAAIVRPPTDGRELK